MSLEKDCPSYGQNIGSFPPYYVAHGEELKNIFGRWLYCLNQSTESTES